MPQRGSWKPAAGLRWLGLAALLAMPWFLHSSLADVSIFLKLDNGKIAGESTHPNHKGEIEILTMSFGASNSGATHFSGGSGAGAANVSDITLHKFTDRSSPELLRRVMNGEPIGEAQIAFVETLDGKDHPVLTFALNNILVTSHTQSAGGGQDRPTEAVALNFAEFTYQTFSYSSTGEPTASPSITWNIVTNSGGTGDANTAPTISAIANQVTDEDTPVTAAFTVGDAETAAGSLVLSRSTTNPSLTPLSGITFGGSGINRTVTITPAANANGTSSITITVTDAGGLTASTTFTVTVNPVNDPPVIQPIANQITDQDTPITVPITVSDNDTPLADVTITAVSENPALIPAGNITISGTGGTRQMTLTPAAGASGSALITLTANDGELDSLPASFTLTVNAITSGPTDIQLSANTVAENSPPDTPVGTLTASHPVGGAIISFSLTDSAGSRFKIGGAQADEVWVDDGSLLDYETARRHTITVRATDQALNTFDKTFIIHVENVNEAPVITAIEVPDIPTEATTPITGLGISDPDSGSSDITVSFTVAAGILALDASGNLEGKVTGSPSKSITVTAPVADIAAALQDDRLTFSTHGVEPGTVALLIEANDHGHTGSGGPQTTTLTVELTLLDTPFNQWRRVKFDAAQLADPAISGMFADADGDGLANLIEYAIGSDPLNPGDGPGFIEFIVEEDDSLRFPAVRFTRLKPDRDPALRIHLEIATDDFNWRHDSEDSIQIRSTALDADRDTVVIRSTLPMADHPRQMMRLRFTMEQ